VASASDLGRLPARAVVRLLERGEVSPLEVIDATVEPLVNAIPTLCPERARDHARRLMAAPAPTTAEAGSRACRS
jgi:amidase